ncbi:hypothetical protein [Adhaeribacter pallidiroseus]|uniref:hypothetical protein n=1 Tax=Adhaeribacter pallidiroseus TaxID=2072847 RepID=UPI001314CF74|nr:hypothetical protein [Adhaeribacter pallidiroseus]
MAGSKGGGGGLEWPGKVTVIGALKQASTATHNTNNTWLPTSNQTQNGAWLTG